VAVQLGKLALTNPVRRKSTAKNWS